MLIDEQKKGAGSEADRYQSRPEIKKRTTIETYAESANDHCGDEREYAATHPRINRRHHVVQQRENHSKKQAIDSVLCPVQSTFVVIESGGYCAREKSQN